MPNSDPKTDSEHEFGGAWTEIKLDAISEYLAFYTTALKNVPKPEAPFVLWYVDAFAGTGERTASRETGGLLEGQPISVERVQLDGSAKRALAIEPPFQHFVFVEKNAKRHSALLRLKDAYPNRNIQCMKGEANTELQKLFGTYPWAAQRGGRGRHRAVVFLDPYAMSVKWKTLEVLAATGAVDVWYLFPLNAVTRQLSRDFAAVDAYKAAKLDEIFGTASWREELYEIDTAPSLFDTPSGARRNVSTQQIEHYARHRLNSVFAYVSQPIRLLTDRGAGLFSLFCLSASPSPKAQSLIDKGVKHVLKKYS